MPDYGLRHKMHTDIEYYFLKPHTLNAGVSICYKRTYDKEPGFACLLYSMIDAKRVCLMLNDSLDMMKAAERHLVGSRETYNYANPDKTEVEEDAQVN